MRLSEEHVRDIGDGVAVVSGLAVFLQWIPALVGIITILYTVFRIAEALDHRKSRGQWPFAKFGTTAKETKDH